MSETQEAAPPPIFTRVEQKPEAIEKVEASLVLVEASERFLTIKDQDTASVAAEWRARAQAHAKALNDERLLMTEGARATVKRINDAFNEKIDELKRQIAKVDKALLAFQREQQEQARRQREELERAQREERERLEAEAKEQGLEAPPEPPPIVPVEPTPEPPRTIQGSHGSKTSTRDNWKYRVVDISQVPEDYLVPPEERINKSVVNALVRSQKDKTNIPGIEVYNEPIITSRTS